jgi:RNA polymerase sigma factor (sigma-70 family)
MSADESDSSLAQACLAGDRKAWETLVRRYRGLLYTIALRCGLSPDDAADVFQTVCLRLLQNLPELRNEAHLTRWLTLTARREAWHLWQQRCREVHLNLGEDSESGDLDDQPAEDPLPQEELMRLEERQLVQLAVHELGPRCRTLLQMLYLSDPRPSYVEVAKRMNMTWTSVGATRVRCLQKLKRILERMGF